MTASGAEEPGALKRKLGLTDAVVIGLGSMIGAGAFVAFAPAAGAAGTGLLLGLAIAAVVALCNATSSAQLAAVYPTSGGAYIYGRERLGPWWGFAAGWSFVIGKTASCVAMALAFAAYAAPAGWERPVAVAAVLLITTVNLMGVTRTARLARILVVLVLGALAAVIAIGASSGLGNITASVGDDVTWYGVLQSAGLMFFAFAGYARIATLAEEVRTPATTIPRAIVIALGIVFVVYGMLAVVALGILGAAGLASTTAPLVAVVEAAGAGWAVPVVQVGAAAACLGALLALIAGVSRTTMAMAREGDLPRSLAAIHPRFSVPHRAELWLAAVVVVLVLIVDLRDAIGFSSFGVLLYYFVANVAAFTQPREHRRYPRAAQVTGAAACLVLVATLPWLAVVTGIGVLLVGIAYRLLSRPRLASNNGACT